MDDIRKVGCRRIYSFKILHSLQRKRIASITCITRIRSLEAQLCNRKFNVLIGTINPFNCCRGIFISKPMIIVGQFLQLKCLQHVIYSFNGILEMRRYPFTGVIGDCRPKSASEKNSIYYGHIYKDLHLHAIMIVGYGSKNGMGILGGRHGAEWLL